MSSTREDKTLERAELVLQAVRSLDIEAMESLVQQAHECGPRQAEAPPEPFPISRQALRMLWHFRCNIESVEVAVESD